MVLVYYQGGESIDSRGNCFQTSLTSTGTAGSQQSAITCDELVRFFAETPGAQLLLLNVAGRPDTRAAGRDWGGDPNTGFLRYACHDPTEACSADPALLGLLQEAISKKGRLGEVVAYVENLLRQQSRKYSPRVVLDEDLARRQINEPDR